MPRETGKLSLTMVDDKPTDRTSNGKKDQDGHGMMKSGNFFPRKKGFAPKRRIEDFLLSRWQWSDELIFFDRCF